MVSSGSLPRIVAEALNHQLACRQVFLRAGLLSREEVVPCLRLALGFCQRDILSVKS